MWSKKTYFEYFNSILALEIEMQKSGKDLLKSVKNPESKKLLRALIKDEEQHEKIVRNLIKLTD